MAGQVSVEDGQFPILIWEGNNETKILGLH